jgi:hypothetical protein
VEQQRCGTCGKPRYRAGQRLCNDCHAAYMREWRKTHKPSEEQRRKAITRAYTKVLIKRGHLARGPCAACGIEPAQAHHPDYSNPRLVVWLCEPHHRQHHWRLEHGMPGIVPDPEGSATA